MYTVDDHDADHGTESPRHTEPDIVTEARRIGLQPTVAYVPRIGNDSPAERQKRKKRERARQRRTEAHARGLQQVNIPDVPAELVDAVKKAVAAVLAGQPTAPPAPIPVQPAPVVMRTERRLALVVAVTLILGFAAGVAFHLLWVDDLNPSRAVAGPRATLHRATPS